MAKRYTKEFREEAVRLAIESGRSRAEIARDLGMSVYTLGEWVRKHEEDSEEASPRKTESLEEENRRLRKENERLKMERDILKKATAYFAKEQL